MWIRQVVLMFSKQVTRTCDRSTKYTYSGPCSLNVVSQKDWNCPYRFVKRLLYSTVLIVRPLDADNVTIDTSLLKRVVFDVYFCTIWLV